MLWLDDDAVPEMDLAAKLYAHQKDMVAPLFYKRGFPFDHTCTQILDPATLDDNGVPYPRKKEDLRLVDPFPRRLFRCDTVGLHALLVRGEVHRGLEELFGGMHLFQLGPEFGEDAFFCQLARHAGFELWVDSTIEVGHVGSFVIDSDYLLSLRAFQPTPPEGSPPSGPTPPVAPAGR